MMSDITKVTEAHDFKKHPEDYDAYLQTIEKVWDMGVRQALTDYVQSPAWTQNRNDPMKAAWLKQMVGRVRSSAFALWKSGRMDLINAKVSEIMTSLPALAGEGHVGNEMTETYNLDARK